MSWQKNKNKTFFSSTCIASAQLMNYILCVFVSLFSSESSEESFLLTSSSVQPSPDSSDRASVSSQPDSSHPSDYLFLSQCETGSVSTSGCVQTLKPFPQAEMMALLCVWQITMVSCFAFSSFSLYVDARASQPLNSLWSKSHQTMRSRTSALNPLRPPSLIPVPVLPFSLVDARRILPSVFRGASQFYHHPLLLHYVTVQ